MTIHRVMKPKSVRHCDLPTSTCDSWSVLTAVNCSRPSSIQVVSLYCIFKNVLSETLATKSGNPASCGTRTVELQELLPNLRASSNVRGGVKLRPLLTR